MTNKIAWLVPFPLKGSGGHRTIFAHIHNLMRRGHECHIYIGEGGNHDDMQPDNLVDLVERFYGVRFEHICPRYHTTQAYDMAVATVWWSAPFVANTIQAKKKIYFIQDFEPSFNPMGDGFILAENTYRMNLTPVTIGRWLSHLMATKYKTSSNYFEFTADQAIYKPLQNTKREQAICFIYQPEKPRRCPIIGREALAIVKHHRPETTIYTYGSETLPDFWFGHKHLGLLSLKQCNNLYNRCSVGLCLSSSNPSRIPFEMMAAGLPVVDFYDDNTLYDLPDGGVLLADKSPGSIAGALIHILDSRSLQNKMSTVGRKFMEGKPSHLEFDQSAEILESILQNSNQSQNVLKKTYRTKAFQADFSEILPPDSTNILERKNILKRVSNRLKRSYAVLRKGYY